MEKNAENNKGIFINGRGQIIEMFKFLTNDEKNRLLKEIKRKNPNLANEIERQSSRFEDIEKLPKETLNHLFDRLEPEVLGLSLKNSSASFQKKILSIANRTYAEKAFEVMIATLPNEHTNSLRAKTRILNILADIYQYN